MKLRWKFTGEIAHAEFWHPSPGISDLEDFRRWHWLHRPGADHPIPCLVIFFTMPTFVEAESGVEFRIKDSSYAPQGCPMTIKEAGELLELVMADPEEKRLLATAGYTLQ